MIIFRKHGFFNTLLREFCDRWLLCSQWADIWGGSGGKTIVGYAGQLSLDRKAILQATGVDAVVVILRDRMQEWLKGFELPASNTIRTLGVLKREQVRDYYAALWLWHRLENKRWEASRITLRDNVRGKLKLEVDHVSPVKLLEERFAKGTTAELHAIGGRESVSTILNSIGNCFLLEKTFNVSKGKQPLSEFLAKVHEFTEGKKNQDEWATALSLGEAHLLPDVADLVELTTKIKEREAIVKDDLVKFVNGSAIRIDIK